MKYKKKPKIVSENIGNPKKRPLDKDKDTAGAGFKVTSKESYYEVGDEPPVEMIMDFAEVSPGRMNMLRPEIITEVAPEMGAPMKASRKPKRKKIKSEVVTEIAPEIKTEVVTEIAPEVKKEVVVEIAPEIKSETKK
jgi:hypothetical protein